MSGLGRSACVLLVWLEYFEQKTVFVAKKNSCFLFSLVWPLPLEKRSRAFFNVIGSPRLVAGPVVYHRESVLKVLGALCSFAGSIPGLPYHRFDAILHVTRALYPRLSASVNEK